MYNQHNYSLGVIITLVYILVAITSGCSQQAEASNTATPVSVQVQQIKNIEVKETRSLSGDVQPWEVLPLSFKVGGRIARIFVEEGDNVKKGETIALLYGRDYVLTRNLANAQIDALSPHLRRAEALRAANALPQSQLDDVQGKMKVARIQRQQAEAQLAYAGLHSTIDGVVVNRSASPGQMAGPTTPVVVIAALDPVKVSLPVAQRDLALLSEGDSIELTSMGIHKPFRGTVHSVGYVADEKTRTFPVIVKVPNPDKRLRAGMIVEAHVTINTHHGIFVPLQAVQRDLEGRPAVLVATNDERTTRASLRRVKPGQIFGDRLQILEGLSSGDKVIVRGLAADGDPITVTEAHRSAPSEPKPSDETISAPAASGTEAQ